jgi:formate dehydrogenase subunit delta
MSGMEQLAQMANDIGNFFRAEPKREDAIAGIANHINKFWTRRMRQKLLEMATHGGAQLDELPRAALPRVNVDAPVIDREPARSPSAR